MTCLKRMHLGAGQKMIMASFDKREGGLSNYKFNQERSRSDLAKMSVLHKYPFSIVEHIGFKTFIRNLQPLFKMVSRNTIKSDILEMYRKKKNKLHEVLDKTPSRISLTTYIWLTCRNQGYLCLAAHYIDDAWLLQNIVLSFAYVSSPHTGDAIATILVDLFMQWNIENKLFSLTLDNAHHTRT
ncbi:hypothetical protein AMTRI_Chr13g82490 [Amborella trichopoda]